MKKKERKGWCIGYKSDMPLEKAYAIIREESGTHFDPAVVEAFFAADIGEMGEME